MGKTVWGGRWEDMHTSEASSVWTRTLMGLSTPSLTTSEESNSSKLQILVRPPETILRHGQVQGKKVGTLGSSLNLAI